MDLRYYQSYAGKLHGAINLLSMLIIMVGFAINYSEGKEANPYGLIVMALGFCSFLKLSSLPDRYQVPLFNYVA
ncbi:MAG: hypothetical protein ACJAT2_002870 [Bacteriovoracaceae bacterium]|jgi:hypothetical protein